VPPPNLEFTHTSTRSPASASYLILESKMRHLRRAGQQVDDRFLVWRS
jgi:hypothetical protein